MPSKGRVLPRRPPLFPITMLLPILAGGAGKASSGRAFSPYESIIVGARLASVEGGRVVEVALWC